MTGMFTFTSIYILENDPFNFLLFNVGIFTLGLVNVYLSFRDNLCMVHGWTWLFEYGLKFHFAIENGDLLE